MQLVRVEIRRAPRRLALVEQALGQVGQRADQADAGRVLVQHGVLRGLVDRFEVDDGGPEVLGRQRPRARGQRVQILRACHRQLVEPADHGKDPAFGLVAPDAQQVVQERPFLARLPAVEQDQDRVNVLQLLGANHRVAEVRLVGVRAGTIDDSHVVPPERLRDQGGEGCPDVNFVDDGEQRFQLFGRQGGQWRRGGRRRGREFDLPLVQGDAVMAAVRAEGHQGVRLRLVADQELPAEPVPGVGDRPGQTKHFKRDRLELPAHGLRVGRLRPFLSFDPAQRVVNTKLGRIQQDIKPVEPVAGLLAARLGQQTPKDLRGVRVSRHERDFPSAQLGAGLGSRHEFKFDDVAAGRPLIDKVFEPARTPEQCFQQPGFARAEGPDEAEPGGLPGFTRQFLGFLDGDF